MTNFAKLMAASALATALTATGAAWSQPAATAPAPAPTTAREQLPDTVIPSHYELSLHPDAEHKTFTGEVTIDVQVRAQVPAIVLNAKDLAFDEARLEDGRVATVSLDPKLERATLSFAGGVAPGAHKLRIRYHAALAQGTIGFFAMDYQTAQGPRRTLATNFEPSGERLLMPSWDEPGRKATFSVTVDAPAGQMAVGNMPIESETPLPGGMKRVRFATTPKMSTYLLFLSVGDYERITDTVDGVEVGVVVPKGQTQRGRYALGEATQLLHYYNNYFGVNFPLPKLDLVASPGRIQGGSMENWGGIFYSQEHLLFDPATSTESDRQLVFLVVSHEMAHQWFGDLVTMAWWDNLWLNEGFARWMQTKAADDLHPEWKTGLQAASIIEVGMRADAKPSTHAVEQPVATVAEANLAFDNITYDKGATVIGMIEDYVTPEKFREGVRRYMKAHTFGNSVSADLWSAMGASAGKPVQGVADDFTHRAGLPLVTVSPTEPAGAGALKLHLAQDRFYEGHRSDAPEPPAAPWRLPLALRSLGKGPAANLLVAGREAEAVVQGPTPIVANAGRKGYVRVRYAPAAFAEIAAHMGELPAADQIGLLQDAWALGQSEYAPIPNLLSLIDAMPAEDDPFAWRQAVIALNAVDGAYRGLPLQAKIRAWAQTRLAPVATRVGWRAQKGEAPGVTALREPLLLALGRFGDPAVVAEARRIDTLPAGDAGKLSPQTRRIARQIVARRADAATFDRLVAQLHATRDSLEKQRLFDDLAGVEDPALATRLLGMVAGPDAPAGSTPSLLGRISREHPELTWNFTKAHLSELPMEAESQMVVVPHLLDTTADPSLVADLRSFVAAHLPPEAGREVTSSASAIELNARVRANGAAPVETWLNGRR